MNIDNLPIGTKLIWDAKEPYEGYSGRLYYPIIIQFIHPYGDAVKIKCDRKISWASGEVDNIRMPTQHELETLTWPNIT